MTSAQIHVTVEILYARWQQLRANGEIISLAELCRDQADLSPLVLERIQTEHPNAVKELSHLTMVAETALLGKESTPDLKAVPLSNASPSKFSVVLKEPAQQTRSFSPDELMRRPRDPAPQLAGFEVLNYLGGGGMGEVYKVKKIGFNIIYALKMIRRDRVSSQLVERFRKEAEAMTRLDHPHIVRVFEVGVDSDQNPYLTMRLLSGGTLAHRLKEWQKDIPKSVELMRKVCSAVAYLHQRGILHRDLKPGNVLFDEHDNPYVTDFGLVKELADNPVSQETPETSHTSSDHLPGLTLEGAVLGTPEYMAPEARAGEHISIGPASDVYGLGVMLCELVFGHRPGKDKIPSTIAEKTDASSRKILRPSNENEVDDAVLEMMVSKCLKTNSADRYTDAGELSRDLEQWSPPKRCSWYWSRRTLLAAGVLTAGGGLSAWAFFHRPRRSESANDPLQEILRQYSEKGEVDLLGSDGMPRWFSGVAGEVAVRPRADKTAYFQCDPGQMRLLEVISGLPVGFKIEAEIRHEGTGNQKGQMGVYFGRSLQPPKQKTRHCMFALTINEFRNWAPAGGNKSWIAFHAAGCAAENATVIDTAPIVAEESLPLQPSGWRDVQIEFTEEMVKVTVDGNILKQTKPSILMTFGHFLSLGRIGESGMVPAFRPEEGIGIYSEGAAVGIRRFRIVSLK